ncbi:MAG: hypothetical protein MI892_28865 [Desulfobacterales bacterium]|nr:hypothetical protein [Desulfobacterales bacterium]
MKFSLDRMACILNIHGGMGKGQSSIIVRQDLVGYLISDRKGKKQLKVARYQKKIGLVFGFDVVIFRAIIGAGEIPVTVLLHIQRGLMTNAYTFYTVLRHSEVDMGSDSMPQRIITTGTMPTCCLE